MMAENDENSLSKDLINTDQLDKINKALKGILDTTSERAIDKFTYTETFEPSKYKMIEVTEQLAEHILEGKEFYLSGSQDDAMVLCTKSKTYNAKEVERTNSMLLTNMGERPKNVCSVLMRNIELTEASLYKPARFREILQSREVNIFNDDSALSEEKMTLNGLFSALPLSEDQVRTLLTSYPIFELNGLIYCLSVEGREELVNEFAYFLNDHDYNQLRESDIIESSIFSSFDSRFSQQTVETIVKWMLHSFFDKIDDSKFKLNHEKIIREVSSHILRKHASKNPIGVAEMESFFYRLMPNEIKFDVNVLRGIAFVKDAVNGELSLKYLNSEDMPLNDKERLEQLFKISNTWTLEDIEPYILDFVESKRVYEYLSKRCRSGTSNGKTLFYPS